MKIVKNLLLRPAFTLLEMLIIIALFGCVLTGAIWIANLLNNGLPL